MRAFIGIILVFFIGFASVAQDVVPKAKTKEQRKADRKKMTLEERIEEALPVEVTLPSARLKLPGEDQQISTLEEAKKYVKETVPNYGKEVKTRIKKEKAELKKLQAKVFDGKNFKDIPVKKEIYKRGSGKNAQYIEFYVLKENQKTLPYRRVMTWYDTKTKRFYEVLSRDIKNNKLLHGPYREYRGDNLVKEGQYYLGVKDGRWMEYDKDFTLLDKTNYNKGFFAESKISYYDDSSKIKEIIPIQYGQTTGNYYKYYPSGALAEEGEFDSGKKIKKWIEYYDNGNRRKKETQYPANFFDENEPYILIEYDENRKIIYEFKKTN